MAKPNQPKDVKPKTEGDDAAKPKMAMDENMKVIIINLVTTILICVLFLSVNYILQSSLLNSKLAHAPAASAEGEEAAAEEAGAEGEGEAPASGVVVDLGDFILNLSDVSPRKFLKVNVAIEVSSKPEEIAAEAEPKKEGGGHGEAAPAANPVEEEMARFKPAMRDAIISNLSSKTSAELSTVPGKELAKEQISEAINGIFAGEREVIRVSFGQFIIQ